MIRNASLLEAVADRIESDPEHWDQAMFIMSTFDCGTSFCIAGWAGFLSGKYEDLESQYLWTTVEYRQLLGLTEAEAEFVFFCGMGHKLQPFAHKEVAEWLRAIASGEDILTSAPEWWTQGRCQARGVHDMNSDHIDNDTEWAESYETLTWELSDE